MNAMICIITRADVNCVLAIFYIQHNQILWTMTKIPGPLIFYYFLWLPLKDEENERMYKTYIIKVQKVEEAFWQKYSLKRDVLFFDFLIEVYNQLYQNEAWQIGLFQKKSVTPMLRRSNFPSRGGGTPRKTWKIQGGH